VPRGAVPDLPCRVALSVPGTPAPALSRVCHHCVSPGRQTSVGQVPDEGAQRCGRASGQHVALDGTEPPGDQHRSPSPCERGRGTGGLVEGTLGGRTGPVNGASSPPVDAPGDRVGTGWRVAVDEVLHRLWTSLWTTAAPWLTCDDAKMACGWTVNVAVLDISSPPSTPPGAKTLPTGSAPPADVAVPPGALRRRGAAGRRTRGRRHRARRRGPCRGRAGRRPSRRHRCPVLSRAARRRPR